MKTETLRKKVRQVIVSRDIMSRMFREFNYKNPIQVEYANRIASNVMKLAAKTHRLLPYYLSTRAI